MRSPGGVALVGGHPHTRVHGSDQTMPRGGSPVPEELARRIDGRG